MDTGAWTLVYSCIKPELYRCQSKSPVDQGLLRRIHTDELTEPIKGYRNDHSPRRIVGGSAL